MTGQNSFFDVKSHCVVQVGISLQSSSISLWSARHVSPCPARTLLFLLASISFRSHCGIYICASMYLFFFFLQYRALNSGPCTCQASTLPLAMPTLHLQCILIRLTPSILAQPPTGFIVIFSYTYTKYMDHIYPSSPSLFTLPTRTRPWTEPVLPFCLSFFKVYIDCSKRFCLHISHMYISVLFFYFYFLFLLFICAYNVWVISILFLLFFFCLLAPLFNSFHCILYCLHTQSNVC
jgi:hypothetical protein